MYLSTITLKNFRKYAYDGANKHGITVNFHKGLNALIGENDSGKSAIIDAIKLVLQTQSGEFTRVMDEDFYISATGEIATEFSIDCIFEGFEINEAKNFVEWLSFEKDKTSGAVFYKLFLHYRAWRENGRIYTELKAGDVEDGISLDGKARELLKCVYLRPLRDAQKEMHSGRNSRISQILFSHPLFSNKEDNLHYEKFADGSVKCIEDEIPFELPDGWAWSRLGAVAEAIGDGDHQPPPQTSFGVPFLVISNVSGGRLSFENTRFVSKEYFSQLLGGTFYEDKRNI